jgi:hypothetical protein
VSHLRRLVAARSIAAREGVSLESVSLEDATGAPPDAEDVAGRVESALTDALERIPPDEVGDPHEFQRALDTLLRETRRAADKLDRHPEAPLSRGERLALEAVVRTDGSRPTLLIRDGAVDPAHPLAREWADRLTLNRDRVRALAGSVGRIEPANATASRFFGTGWVVDAAQGLVLTNLHVLEAMWQRLPHTMVKTGDTFRLFGGAFMDFAVESGSTATHRFQVVEAKPSGVDGPEFARLDAAVLRIEPADGQAVPQAVPVVADPDGPRGNLASFCVIGFPGPPAHTTGVHEVVDWAWVNATLFGNRYGVKRLAPGLAHRPLGSFAGDDRPWVFGHDATTLGGSSGSPILSWLDDAPAAFGLHFAGASVDTNCAHAVAAAAESLVAMGVPVRASAGR